MTKSTELKALSDAATKAILVVEKSAAHNYMIVETEGYATIAFDLFEADAEYIAELANLHRSGQLVHVDEVEKLKDALEELSCRHVTEKPLWWQDVARAALSAIGGDNE